MVRYGRCLPDGFLPVYSVGSEAEAKSLLMMACPTNLAGEYIARELVGGQTLENLSKFGRHLDLLHTRLVETGRCDCGSTDT